MAWEQRWVPWRSYWLPSRGDDTIAALRKRLNGAPASGSTCLRGGDRTHGDSARVPGDPGRDPGRGRRPVRPRALRRPGRARPVAALVHQLVRTACLTHCAAGSPLPVSTQITLTAEPFGDLLAVHGLPDAAAIDTAVEALGAVASQVEPIVVDLRDAVLVPPGPVLDLVAALRQHTRGRPMALICDRLSGRRLLRSRCRHLGVAVVDAIPNGLPA
jgi:hypothetical protein